METQVPKPQKKSFWSKYFILLVATLLAKLMVGLMAGNVYFQTKQHDMLEKQVSQQFLIIESLNSLTAELKKQQTSTSSDTEKRYSFDDFPFAQHADRISEEVKMELRRVCEHIMRDEGKRAEPYPDSIGIAIGVGRNLTTYGVSTLELRAINPKVDVTQHLENISIGDKMVYIDDLATAKTILNTPLSDHHIALLLLSNLKNVAKEAEHVFGETWQKLDGARKESIVDVMFNLGLPNFTEFKKFIAAVKKNDFDVAANELLLSRAAQQNPTRYQRNAAVIRTGDPSHFELE